MLKKTILKRPYYLLAVAAVLVAFLLTAFYISTHSRDALAQPEEQVKALPDDNTPALISHFHNTGWGTFKNISEQVAPYFLGKTQDEAVSLLKENGFKVEIVTDLRMRQYFKSEGIVPNPLIKAERGAGWRFWRVLTDYRVSLYLNDGEIVHVVAVVHGFFAKL